MDALEVRQHNITVEIMTMIVAGMGHDSVRDGALVIARKGEAAAGTCLLEGHVGHHPSTGGRRRSRAQWPERLTAATLGEFPIQGLGRSALVRGPSRNDH